MDKDDILKKPNRTKNKVSHTARGNVRDFIFLCLKSHIGGCHSGNIFEKCEEAAADDRGKCNTENAETDHYNVKNKISSGIILKAAVLGGAGENDAENKADCRNRHCYIQPKIRSCADSGVKLLLRRDDLGNDLGSGSALRFNELRAAVGAEHGVVLVALVTCGAVLCHKNVLSFNYLYNNYIM